MNQVPDVNGLFVLNGNVVSVESGGSINVAVGSSTDDTIGLRVGDGFGGPANSNGTLIVNNGHLSTSGDNGPNNRAADIKIGVTASGGTPGHGFAIQSGSNSLVEGQDYVLGNGTLCSGVYTLNDGTLHSRTWSFIGENAGFGTFTMNGGTFLTSGGGFVGHGVGGQGTLNLNGGIYIAGEEANVGEAGGVGVVNQSGGNYQTGTLLSIGRGAGAGTFNLSSGSVTTVSASTAGDRDMVIGADPGSIGVFNQTGGSVQLNRWAFVGRASGTGTYNISNGTISTRGWIRVAENKATGTFNLSGTGVINCGNGDADLGDDLFVVGVDPGSNAFVNVTGGALNVLGTSGRLFLGQGGGAGTVTQSAGVVNAQSYASIGVDGPNTSTKGTGTYNISGGTLTSANDLNVGDTANSIGLLQVSSVGFVQAREVWVAHAAGATGTLNQSGGTIATGTGGMQINAGGVYNLSAGVISAGTFINNGLFNFTGGSPSITAIDGTGTTTVGGGSISTGYIRQGTISISGGNLTTTGGTSVAGTISIASGNKFDLTNNALIINGSNATDVRALIQRGRAGGPWTGDGLTSSRAATATATSGAPKTALGYASGSQLGIATFDSQALAPTAYLVRYSYLGDANLDGTVNMLDFNALATNFGTGSSLDWNRGDFNYDGAVNTADFTALAANFNQTTPVPGPQLGAIVPEPLVSAFVAAAGWMLVGRRRRG